MGGKVKWKREACENEDQVTLSHRGRGTNALRGRLKKGTRTVGKRPRGSHEGSWGRWRFCPHWFFFLSSSSFPLSYHIHTSSGETQREREDWTPDFKTVPTLKAPSLTNGVPENSPSEDVLNPYVSNQVFFSSLEKAYVSNCSISESTFGDADFISLSAP